MRFGCCGPRRYNIEMKLPIETAHLVDERLRQQLPDATLVQVVCCAAHAAVWMATARITRASTAG